MSDKMKYEPPKLIEFNDHIDISKGACAVGSATTVCNTGVTAGLGCWSDGVSATGPGCIDMGNTAG
jgi:hypothetical protein